MCQGLSRQLCMEFYFKFSQSLCHYDCRSTYEEKEVPVVQAMTKVHKDSEWQNHVSELMYKLQILLAELSHLLPLKFHPIPKPPKLCQCFLWTLTANIGEMFEKSYFPPTKGYICNVIHFLMNNLNYNVFFPIVLL